MKLSLKICCLLLFAVLSGCADPAGQAAKKDAAAIQRSSAAGAAQLASASAASSDATRIDAKAVILLHSKWQ